MVMKIDYVSDLHMEINGNVENCVSSIDGDGDFLFLVGDISCYRYFKPDRTDGESRAMRKRFQKFINKQPHKEIFLIPGNHEYYRFYWHGADRWFDGIARSIDPRFRVLQDDCVVLDGKAVAFGATFWTNFNNYNPMDMMAVGEGMNDFHVIQWKKDEDVTYTDRHASGKFNNRFTPTQAYRAHEKSWRMLKDYYNYYSETADNFLVFTHHGPSMRSHNVHRFGDTALKHGYLSDYDSWIYDMNISHWIHGHTHHDVDYEIGGTQIKSAMYGYIGYDRLPTERKMKFGRIEL